MKETGIATIINWGARDLGGSFSNGRGFTQVLYVSPTDMTWHPDGKMLATCPILDSIVSIDLETGLAGRITFNKDFCLRHPEGDTDFHREFGGYPVIGGANALAWTNQGLYMWGISRRNMQLVDRGYRSFGAFYKISTYLKCATAIGSPIFFGQPTKGPDYPDEGEAYAYAFSFDEEHLYMSGAFTHALYIINQQTGSLHFIANWHFTTMPEGYKTYESGGILNIEKNALEQIQITGLAYDGIDMFAIESSTNALYKLERK